MSNFIRIINQFITGMVGAENRALNCRNSEDCECKEGLFPAKHTLIVHGMVNQAKKFTMA